MNCRRAFDLDITGFLVHPDAAEFDGFRAHYPECADCAAEVRTWTDLHLQLQAGGPGSDSAHPSPEKLLCFDEQPNSLKADERRRLEEHLAGCLPCRDELASLRSFDLSAAVEAPLPARHPPQAAVHFVVLLRRLFWNPAFAYGLVVLLSLPLLFSQSPRFAPAPRASYDLAPESPPVQRKIEATRKDADDETELFDEGAEQARPEAEPATGTGEVRQLQKGQVESFRGKEAPVQLERDPPHAGQPDAGAPSSVSARGGRGLSQLPQGGERIALGTSALEEVDAGLHIPVPESTSRTAATPPVEGFASLRRQVPPLEDEPRPASGTMRTLEDWALVELRPGLPAEVRRSRLGSGLELRIPLSESQRDLQTVEVRIPLPGTEQELSQRFVVGPQVEHVEMRVPAVLLAAGDYVLQLHATETPGPPLQTFAFSVR